MTPNTDSVAVLRELLDKARKLATAITRAQYEDTGRLSMELVFDLEAAIAHPAPPGSDAVTEEEISWLAMEAASFIDNEYQHGRARPNAHRIREHLRAALAARTGKGETL